MRSWSYPDPPGTTSGDYRPHETETSLFPVVTDATVGELRQFPQAGKPHRINRPSRLAQFAAGSVLVALILLAAALGMAALLAIAAMIGAIS